MHVTLYGYSGGAVVSIRYAYVHCMYVYYVCVCDGM